MTTQALMMQSVVFFTLPPPATFGALPARAMPKPRCLDVAVRVAFLFPATLPRLY